MLFEDLDPGRVPARQQIGSRVVGGTVEGQSDCWVVVAREERDLDDWLRSEEQAIEAAPLRMCRAVLDNGDLILAAAVKGAGIISMPDFIV